MSPKTWKVTFHIYRQKGEQKPYYQDFLLDVNPEEYVLDGIERIWAFHDRTLTYRHACHHSTCGACGMRVNGVEKLTCITPIHSVVKNDGKILVEPLRNFPVQSDLVVDMGVFFQNLEMAHFSSVTPLKDAKLPKEKLTDCPEENYERLVDCLECGMCVSACPSALTSADYYGPAMIAATQHEFQHSQDRSLLTLADCHNGAWRCHSAFECTEVCPSNVDPGRRIMELRRLMLGNRIRRLFGR